MYVLYKTIGDTKIGENPRKTTCIGKCFNTIYVRTTVRRRRQSRAYKFDFLPNRVYYRRRGYFKSETRTRLHTKTHMCTCVQIRM